MALEIDHVPFAWHDLDVIVEEFERLGLEPEYGGVHGNDVTHMSVLGFDDHSYVELISERRDADHEFWPAHIRNDAGPATWCVEVEDVAAACKRAIDAGHVVRGPFHDTREREDGRLVEWDRAVLGNDRVRLVLPFLIDDRTPVSYRVSPSPSVSGGPLTGVSEVVIATRDPDALAETFGRLYRFPTPRRTRIEGFGRVHSFPGEPVSLATPDGGWLDDRLDRFRDGPCTCLLGTDDLEAAGKAFPLREPIEWPGGRVAFFESDVLDRKLGVIERE